MRSRRAALWLVAAFVAGAAASAQAAVVTVTPLNEITPVGQRELGETELTDGWSIVTNAKGWAKLSTFGPALYQARNQQGNTPFIAGDPEVHPNQTLGRGTFYATCDMWIGGGIPLDPSNPDAPYYKTPSTCWLGTNTWKGQPLAGRTLGSINQMDYYSFVDKCPTRYAALKNEMGWWQKANWWNGPQQPIQLHLVVISPDGGEMRQLWYRPWGYNYVGDDGLREPGSKKGRWQHFNCLLPGSGSSGKWYTPLTGGTPSTNEYGWTSWEEMMSFSLPVNDPPTVFLPPFSEWKLADPATIWKTPGWDRQTVPEGAPMAVGTGKPLNFFVGARKQGIKPLFLQGNITISWYNHIYGERAQVDYFSLGFEGEGTETYDFEPLSTDRTVQTVGLSQKALRDLIMTSSDAKKNFLFKITGLTGNPPANQNQGFVLEDGSKLTYHDPGYDPTWIETIQPGPVRVFLPDTNVDLWIGEIADGMQIAVEGFVESLRFPGAPSDHMIMWTNFPGNITY